MNPKRSIKGVLMLVLLALILLQSFPTSNVAAQAEFKPTKGWGMFFDTTGNVNFTITKPGVAVRVEVPREFLDGVIARSNRQTTNDTGFIKSDISNDYYYYSIIDQSEYYSYAANAPYSIEIQKPPDYTGPGCTPVFTNFTVPRFILLQGLAAPEISGIYNFTVFIAGSVDTNGKPIFPPSPDKVFPVHVSMREDPSHIYGYIVDDKAKKFILAKGVAYAKEVNTGRIGRGFVNSSTGFFNITGLYAGTYVLEGSAGFFPDTGYAYAPTLSPYSVSVTKGAGTNVYNFTLNRGNVINGSITYTDQLGNAMRPLDTPYLNALGFSALNYTVEVVNGAGNIVASRIYASQNLQTERYSLSVRNGTRYVGYPALGTEFAGFGPGTYTIRIWVYGFTLPATQIKVITLGGYGEQTDVGESRLPYGGVISGTIRLKSGPLGSFETPREAESLTFGTSTGTLFGGNILIELYNQAGTLRGLAILNRTLPNGTVQYADFSSGDQTPLLRYYILGFSELHNRTYSSAWVVGSNPGPSPWDYGLENGTYYARIWIRGYIQEDIDQFTLSKGGNTTVISDLRRGGSVQVTVRSSVVRPGTRWPQQPTKFWRFFELCPPPRLRIYFYASSGIEIGYTEGVLTSGSLGVENNTATLDFTGHNWSVEDIILRGFTPSALDEDNYDLKAYTYGYIQAEDIEATISLTDYSPTHVEVAFPLLVGGRIHGAVSLFMNGVSVSLTEDVTVRPQVTISGNIAGTDVVDARAGGQGFSFSTYGFYGRGHFFYVNPYGNRTKDYGLDSGEYGVFIPDFGYHRRFMQTATIQANIQELGWETEVFYNLDRMIKITGTITGFNKMRDPVHLVWAEASSDSVSAYSYDGDFYLHLPTGTHTLTFSCPGYVDQTRTVSTNDEASVGTIVLEQSGAPFT